MFAHMGSRGDILKGAEQVCVNSIGVFKYFYRAILLFPINSSYTLSAFR